MKEESTSSFSLLPEDIHLRILLHLTADDILRCRKTCRLLGELTRTLVVQYKIELDAMGLVDIPTTPRPMVERHERLQAYRHRWHNARFAWDKKFPASRRPECWNWTGGLLPYILDPDSADEPALHLYRPASTSRGTADFSWSLPREVIPDGYRIYSCCADISQDLLVLVLIPGPAVDQGIWMAQLVSISQSGLQHPHATSSFLHGPIFQSRPRPKACVIRVSGDITGLEIMNATWELLVWNWKTNTLLWYSKRIDFQHFILPGPSYMILMPAQQSSELVLHVFRLGHQPDPPAVDPDFQNRQPMAILRAFAFVGGLTFDAELVPPQSTHDTPADHPIFVHRADQAIFAMYLHLQNIAIGDVNFGLVGRFLLLISIPSILERLDRIRDVADQDPRPAPPRVLEWYEWGPTDTRLIALTGTFPWRGRIRTCDSRCAVEFGPDLRTDQHGVRVVFFDAHPAAASLPHEDLAQALRVVDVSETITRPKLFKHPVRTTFPIRISCREVRPTVPEPIAVGLLGDGLVFRYRPSVRIDPPEGGLFGFYV